MEEDGLAADGGAAYEALGPLYDVWCAEVVEDIPFYRTLAASLAADLGRDALDIVELGGGSGRITIPLAADGHRVTAIDRSREQLQLLEGRAARLGLADRIRIVEADMRALDDIVAPASVDLVLAPFRALLHVTPDRDALFAAARRALRPGGVLAFDVFHPTAEQVGTTHGRWLHRREAHTERGAWSFQERARYLPELAAEPGGLKLEVDVRCRWRARRARIRRPSWELVEPDPSPSERGDRHALLELQLVPAERWAASLADAGFTVDGSYGWFDARPLEPHDDDSIWVARVP